MPNGSSGASNLYLRRTSAACLDLAPSEPSEFTCILTSPLYPSAMPRCGLCGATGSCLLAISSLRLVLPLTSVSWVAGDFPSPPCPRPSAPGTPFPLRVTPEVESPRGNSSTLGVSVTLGNSTPPPTPWQSPPGFSATREALGPPSMSLTPEESSAGFSCQPATLSFSFFPPHGGLLLLMRMHPWRGHLRWRPCQPLHPLVRLPRRFPPIPLTSPSASF